jgi:hypothetical protein
MDFLRSRQTYHPGENPAILYYRVAGSWALWGRERAGMKTPLSTIGTPGGGKKMKSSRYILGFSFDSGKKSEDQAAGTESRDPARLLHSVLSARLHDMW